MEYTESDWGCGHHDSRVRRCRGYADPHTEGESALLPRFGSYLVNDMLRDHTPTGSRGQWPWLESLLQHSLASDSSHPISSSRSVEAELLESVSDLT